MKNISLFKKTPLYVCKRSRRSRKGAKSSPTDGGISRTGRIVESFGGGVFRGGFCPFFSFFFFPLVRTPVLSSGRLDDAGISRSNPVPKILFVFVARVTVTVACEQNLSAYPSPSVTFFFFLILSQNLSIFVNFFSNLSIFVKFFFKFGRFSSIFFFEFGRFSSNYFQIWSIFPSNLRPQILKPSCSRF